MDGAVELPGRDVGVVQARLDRARGRAELPRAVAELAAVEQIGLEVLEPDDVRRPHARRRQLRLGERALELPLVRRVDVEERRADAELVDAREPVVAARAGAPPVPVREHVEPVGARDERVRRAGREVDDARARRRPRRRRPRRRRPLPREPRAAEHVEDLLVVAVRVERRRAAAGVDADAVDADADGAGGLAEVAPAGVDRALLVVVLLDLVPVRDVRVAHAGSIRAESASPQRSTASAARSSPSCRAHASASRTSARSSSRSSGRGRAAALERLDPLQPLQHRACLLHPSDGTGGTHLSLCRLCAFLDSGHARLSRVRGGQPRPRPLGKVFWAGAVARWAAGTPLVRVGLHELSRKELVRPARISSVRDEAEYAFWHALVRDVAYGQILAPPASTRCSAISRRARAPRREASASARARAATGRARRRARAGRRAGASRRARAGAGPPPRPGS